MRVPTSRCVQNAYPTDCWIVTQIQIGPHKKSASAQIFGYECNNVAFPHSCTRMASIFYFFSFSVFTRPHPATRTPIFWLAVMWLIQDGYTSVIIISVCFYSCCSDIYLHDSKADTMGEGYIFYQAQEMMRWASGPATVIRLSWKSIRFLCLFIIPVSNTERTDCSLAALFTQPLTDATDLGKSMLLTSPVRGFIFNNAINTIPSIALVKVEISRFHFYKCRSPC